MFNLNGSVAVGWNLLSLQALSSEYLEASLNLW